MKICFPFIGDTIGGSHISSLILIRHLINKGHDVLVFVHQKGPLVDELERQDIVFKYLPVQKTVGQVPKTLSQIWFTVSALFRITWVLRSNSTDLIHTNDMRAHLAWTLPARLAGVSHVWHQRTALPLSRIVSLMARIPRAVVCISQFVRQTIPLRLRQTVHIVPNPVERNHVDKSEREYCRSVLKSQARTRKECVILGAFGNLRKVKDPLTIVRAFVILSQMTKTPVILAIFGEDREGWQQQMAQIANDRRDGSQCIFMGFRRPVSPWIAGCDIVLAASTGDGFGRTIVEAMSLGVPVIAAAAGGHEEIIENTVSGLLVSPSDPTKMADAAWHLICDPQLKREIVINARERVCEMFSEEKTLGAIEKVYDELKLKYG
jgi:glycosyltransferase involved in cell wall biosynthesis